MEPLAEQVKIALNFDILIRIFQVCTLDSIDYLGKSETRRQIWEQTFDTFVNDLNGAFDESMIPWLLYTVCMTSPSGVGFENLFKQHDYIFRKLLEQTRFWCSDASIQKKQAEEEGKTGNKTTFPLFNKKMFKICELFAEDLRNLHPLSKLEGINEN